jgi:predicted 3-demethylubiquinone-9 3-methyltransferase (glyoxalase superfamily)
MQKIIPNLWFDKEAEEAAEFYTAIFANSKIGAKTYYGKVGKEIHGQDEGTLLTVDFELEGYRFVALNGGPLFKFNPSISFFVRCSDEKEVDDIYSKLSVGGNVLMPLAKYDFSEKYAWISDKYGLTWQLFLGEKVEQKIAPCLLFVGDQTGKAEEAMNLYTSIFPESKLGQISKYEEAESQVNNAKVKYGQFWLAGQELVAMDSGIDHKFAFNEAISLLVECKDQAEIDEYWGKLSAVPESEQCGWLKDKFGVSWQIAPEGMDKYLNDPDQSRADRVMAAFLKMKKIDIAEIEAAAQ